MVKPRTVQLSAKVCLCLSLQIIASQLDTCSYTVQLGNIILQLWFLDISQNNYSTNSFLSIHSKIHDIVIANQLCSQLASYSSGQFGAKLQQLCLANQLISQLSKQVSKMVFESQCYCQLAIAVYLITTYSYICKFSGSLI